MSLTSGVPDRPSVPGGFRRLLALAALAGGLWACGGAPPRAPNPTRPLDERRAVEIIIQAFHDQRDRPVPGQTLQLGPNRSLEVDVSAQGRKYGVAYVTAKERSELGSALPARDPNMPDALQLVSGLGTDGDARVLVVHDSDYLYDDHVGEEHEDTSMTAE